MYNYYKYNNYQEKISGLIIKPFTVIYINKIIKFNIYQQLLQMTFSLLKRLK